MAENELLDSIPDKCVVPTTFPVDALIDKIVFKDFEDIILENEIKVWKNIKCIDLCNVEFIRKCITICDNEWIISITYRLIVEYTSIWGMKHLVTKVCHFEKAIKFPLTEVDCEFINYAKAAPHLFVEADCIKADFKNFDHCSIIITAAKLDIRFFATVKKEYFILTVCPEPVKKE